MALDLLLIAHHPTVLRSACRRGWWGPLSLPSTACCCLTHLTVLPPRASSIQQLAPIQRITPWTLTDEPPIGALPASDTSAGDRPAGEHPPWRLMLAPLLTLRRPIPLGSGPLLRHWWPHGDDPLRLLSIDGLLLSDSLADYLLSHQLAPSGPQTTKRQTESWQTAEQQTAEQQTTRRQTAGRQTAQQQTYPAWAAACRSVVWPPPSWGR